MPDVSFSVGPRRYTLRCALGQEEHLRTVAAALDARVQPLARAAGGVDDRQLLVMAAIGLLDELQAANRLAQAADAANPTPEADTATAITTLQAENTALRAEAAALREWASTMATRLANLAEDPALA
mgnify:CR=1 FL=1